jgi:uncharacterized protein with PIN domain
MLGSVARKLRIFGFDTLYLRHFNDEDVLKIGVAQNRIILTCDRELFRRIVKAGAHGALLQGSDDLEDIAHVLSKYQISSISFSTFNSRCSACNGLIIKEKIIDIKRHLPSNIIKWHDEFFQCTNCNKIYWEGSHVIRIRALARELNIKLKKKEARSK